MYAYIDGILEDVETENIVVEAGGIGYNIRVYCAEMLSLPSLGSGIKVYTYTSVAEDRFMLYGFLEKQELDLFRLLITVNGVGPKTAQAMITELGYDNLRVAIATEDSKLISKAPGIGAKSAARIIIDLKDKIRMDYTTISKTGGSNGPAAGTTAKLSPVEEECVTALVNLGYSRNNAVKAVEQVENREEMHVEELLKISLRNVMFM